MAQLRRDLMEAGLPRKYLGLGVQSWSMIDICNVLDYYDVPYRPSRTHEIPSKFELIELLHDLINSRGLTRNHRFLILKGRYPRTQRSVCRCSSSDSPMDVDDGSEPEDASLPDVNGNTPSSSSSSADSSDADLDDCVVCDEPLTASNTPNRPPTLACEHKPDVCLHCLSRSITAQLEGKVWNHIDCPSCDARLSFEDVRAFGTRETFQRYPFLPTTLNSLAMALLTSSSYDNLATSEAISSIPGFRRCLAAGCTSGQIHEGGADEPIVTCQACGSKACFTHQTAWHAGETCEAFGERMAEERRVEDGENAAYMRAHTKRCPNGECRRPIEKDGGCSHMECEFSSFSSSSSSSSSTAVVQRVLQITYLEYMRGFDKFDQGKADV